MDVARESLGYLILAAATTNNKDDQSNNKTSFCHFNVLTVAFKLCLTGSCNSS